MGDKMAGKTTIKNTLTKVSNMLVWHTDYYPRDSYTYRKPEMREILLDF